MEIKIKIKQKNPKKEFFCDKCGCSSLSNKMYRKKTFPFGKKSKPVYYNKCRDCKYPGKTKRLRIRLI